MCYKSTNNVKEQKIQSRIIKKLESLGYFIIKTIVTNKSGIPDLIAVKEGQVIFFEVKRNNGHLSALQQYRIKVLREYAPVYVVYDDSELEKILLNSSG